MFPDEIILVGYLSWAFVSASTSYYELPRHVIFSTEKLILGCQV